jgi:hypothetical protein
VIPVSLLTANPEIPLPEKPEIPEPEYPEKPLVPMPL